MVLGVCFNGLLAVPIAALRSFCRPGRDPGPQSAEPRRVRSRLRLLYRTEPYGRIHASGPRGRACHPSSPTSSRAPRRSRASPSCTTARIAAARSRPAPPGAARSTPRWRSSTPARRCRPSRGAGASRCCSASSGCSPRRSPSSPTARCSNAHQVDALSGTLTALLAEAGNGASTNGRAAAEPASRSPRPAIPGEEDDDDEDEPEEPQDWEDEAAAATRRRRAAPRGARGPQRGQALLVRARDRRRQDGRRARLRRGLAHRRHPDPHPPPQPRRPVPRRAARPRLRASGSPRRSCAARTAPTARSRSRPTSGSCATPATSPTPTRSSSATRRTRRWARRRRPRSATGTGPSSSA